MSHDARKQMKELEYVSSILNYVKKFLRFMLQIDDTSEKDKLFNSMNGL